MIYIRFQVADGMHFLSSKRIYHGDLAARNILLTDELDAKISDFGLSKRLYQDLDTAQNLRKNESESLPLLPIKWVAMEVLAQNEYVPEKSDVWSYGVLVWELFSVAMEPYGTGKLLQIIDMILNFKIPLIPIIQISL